MTSRLPSADTLRSCHTASEEYPDLLPAWHAFRDTRARDGAVQWLADNSLIDGGFPGRFLSGRLDPVLP
jgi:hypothetical protein